MIQIGKFNHLRIVKAVDFGLYLDGGEEEGEILLPKRYVPEDAKPDDWLDVFIYLDSEDRIIATTETPLAQVGDFACLRAVSVNQVGAFLDWGLMKDLMVPFREQKIKMREGGNYIVYIYEDTESGRIVASAKIDKFIDKTAPVLSFGDEVDVLICQRTDLGYKVIINNRYVGVLYENEVFKRLELGELSKAYIKQIREDGKIDLLLEKPGYEKIEGLAGIILQKLQNSDGYLALNDKTEADTIYDMIGISKKNFKKAIGDLYKKKIINIENDGIRLLIN